MSISCQTLIPQGYPYNNLSTSKNTAADLYSIGMPLEVKQLDTQSAAVFTNLMKEESYPHFEVRAMLLGEKGTGKTTVNFFPLKYIFI
jgi:hypothetical protein